MPPSPPRDCRAGTTTTLRAWGGWSTVGVDGIYLDGIGYDREIMKRVRKVMDRAQPGA